MFPTASSVDPRLAEAAAAVEAASLAQRVLAARVFRLPYARLKVRAAVQAPRRFNILEEFVLRAAAELTPPPTPAELAALLGLDALFVDSTLRQLETLQAVAKGGGQAAVKLTPQGRQFLTQGQALQPPEHKALSFIYRGGVEDLRLWAAPAAVEGDLPVLPGLTAEAREQFVAQAQAALKLPRVLAAAEAAGLKLHVPAEGRLLTAVDQVAVEDSSFAAVGVLLVQDVLGGQVSVRALDLASQAADAPLQAALDQWLKAGRIQWTDFLPPEAEANGDSEPIPAPAAALDEAPDYAERYRQSALAQAPGGQAPALEVELLRAGSGPARAQQLLAKTTHSALLLAPRLTPQTAGEGLRADLQALAARGVLTVVGWGTADEREQEPVAPAPGVVEALQRLLTPEGLPGVAVWWVGSLYGQDVVLDGRVLVSSVPGPAPSTKAAAAPPVSTYVITAPDLVTAALDDLEPSFARAARLAWHAAARSPAQARQALGRCCLTWVAVRRPGEALSHVLKLAAQVAEEEPEAMLVAWELLAATLLPLARRAAADPASLANLGLADALRRAVPEFLDWSDSVLAPGSSGQTPYVAALHALLGQAGFDAAALPALLADVLARWQSANPPGALTAFSDAFTVAAEADPRRDRLAKKRRY